MNEGREEVCNPSLLSAVILIRYTTTNFIQSRQALSDVFVYKSRVQSPTVWERESPQHGASARDLLIIKLFGALFQAPKF